MDGVDLRMGLRLSLLVLIPLADARGSGPLVYTRGSEALGRLRPVDGRALPVTDDP
jgi:hypothetical protein